MQFWNPIDGFLYLLGEFYINSLTFHSWCQMRFFFENLYTKCVGHNKNEGDYYESFHGDQKYFLSNSALWSYSEFQILHHTDLCAGYIIDTVIKECQLAYTASRSNTSEKLFGLF